MSLAVSDRLDILDVLARADNAASRRDPDAYVELFTDDVVLDGDQGTHVAVCSDPGSQLMVNAPWLVETDDGHLQVEILVRGLWFHIVAGTGVPDRYLSLCLMRSPRRSIFLGDFAEQFLMMNRHFFETADDRVRNRLSANLQ
jgi:hypothetical protein